MLDIKNCPICSSVKHGRIYSAPTTRKQDQRVWTVSACRDCGHQFMNPQPTWAELEFYYDASYEPYDPMHGSDVSDESAIEKALSTGLIRHIPIPKDKRLLDVGCGGGNFLRLTGKLGAFAEGIEPSKFASDVASKQGLVVFCGTVEEFAAMNNSKRLFDIITANHVIEHIPNPVETLCAMKNLMAPNGLIWISVPNANYPINRAIKGRWHSADLPYHLMQFTSASVARAGERAGLKVRRQYTESLPHIVKASLGEYLRYRWMLPRRLTNRLGFLPAASKWYANYVDTKSNGEAIITEFFSE